jgi:hypothetical protein
LLLLLLSCSIVSWHSAWSDDEFDLSAMIGPRQNLFEQLITESSQPFTVHLNNFITFTQFSV